MYSRVQVGVPLLNVHGKAWGTVLSKDTIRAICTVRLEPDKALREFGLYEVHSWLQEGVLVDDRHFCPQCNAEIGMEYILGPVCGKCVKKNHRKATGRGGNRGK